MENLHHEHREENRSAENDSAAANSPAYAYPRPNPYILPGSILLAALIVAGSIIYMVNSGGGGGGDKAPVLKNPLVPAAAALAATDPVLGNENAPVLVIEYGDYQCPFCGRYHLEVEPVIKERYVDTGKVKFVFRHLAFLGPESVAAAEAAECAKEQGKFWEYNSALYAEEIKNFNETREENNGNLNRALFLKLAKQVGVGDMPAFTKCVDARTYAGRVEEANAAASAIGVQSTPTTFVNGYKVVALDAKGNPVPSAQGELQSVGANLQSIISAIDKAL